MVILFCFVFFAKEELREKKGGKGKGLPRVQTLEGLVSRRD